MTIQDILDWVVDNGFEIKVYDLEKGEERDYNEDTDSNKDINSFEFYHQGDTDYLVFNI